MDQGKKIVKRKRKTKLSSDWWMVIIGIIIAMILFMILPDESYSKGRAYLKSQNELSVSELRSKIDQRNEQEAAQKLAETINEINTGQKSVWSLFQNTALVGDSRVYGFKSYNFLPWDQVIADAGWTIANIPDQVDTIAALNPKTIFLSFGVNDMGLEIGKDRDPDGYAKVYEENIKMLLEKCPNAKIVVNSIIYPTEEAVERAPRWGKTEEYNRQIKEMCERNGWTYIDNSAICDQGKAEIYQSDGVHFLPDFYEVWAKNMLKPLYPGLQ